MAAPLLLVLSSSLNNGLTTKWPKISACAQPRRPPVSGVANRSSQAIAISASASDFLPLVTDKQANPSPPSTHSQLVKQPGAATTSGLSTRTKGKQKATV
ncbi:hypothetical protein BJV77DRAFT_1072217 [Russula vinacea]|nr:hypothetical protein BJV77DRAFT_1072217 [Russula vinacea]